MLRARDIMTPDVEAIPPDMEVSEVLSRLARAEFNGFPVVDDGDLVGIVTQGDLVALFQTEDRVLWIPIGLPPFTETVTYAVDVSWDDLDLGVDLAKHAGKPTSEVMTRDVVAIGPDDDLDRILELLSGEINRLPVLDDGALVGIVTREDVVRTLAEERTG